MASNTCQGQRWLITGVSSGIGEALAQAVLAQGGTVIGAARTQEAVRKFEESCPGRAIGLLLDVSKTDQAASAVAGILSQGPIDVLVNNAGQSLFGAYEEVSVDEVRALFDVNVLGPLALTQAVLPHFRERGRGLIINVSSGSGVLGTPGVSAYSASKFALEGFSEAMAQEVAGFGIRVLLVEPGAIATRFISHGTAEAKNRLPAYEFLSGQGKTALDAYYATSASPPENVANAIIEAAAREDAPLRVIVGDDTRYAVRKKAEDLTAAADA